MRSPAEGSGEDAASGARAVLAEAERRLRAAGYERLRARALATGVEMPKEMKYLHMQIDFVAKTLSSLDVVPDDFRADRYWPAVS